MQFFLFFGKKCLFSWTIYSTHSTYPFPCLIFITVRNATLTNVYCYLDAIQLHKTHQIPITIMLQKCYFVNLYYSQWQSKNYSIYFISWAGCNPIMFRNLTALLKSPVEYQMRAHRSWEERGEQRKKEVKTDKEENRQTYVKAL